MCSHVKRLLSELHKQIEDCEMEEHKEKTKKKNVNQSLVLTLEEYIENHKWYIEKLEIVLRQLDNEILNPYVLDDCLGMVEDYIASYRDKDYFFDSSVFDDLELVDSSRVTTPIDNSDTESAPEPPAVASATPATPEPEVKSPATRPMPPLPTLLSPPAPKPSRSICLP